MELTIKLNLDRNVHSKNELIEASKYLKLLSQHFEVNLIQKKGTLGKDKTFFKFNTDMPINDKKENEIGFYRIDKKEKIKDITESELMEDLNKWSRKHFGYTKNGYFHFDGKKTKIKDDDDFDEWED
tara:strand:- start:95 stop:475 length:381 start_codon:yes stop_codon:yes gene_type:complete